MKHGNECHSDPHAQEGPFPHTCAYTGVVVKWLAELGEGEELKPNGFGLFRKGGGELFFGEQEGC